ncbi:unnamed protein product [Anisakis simplex]|uniref:CIA30 domain-containing protein n=1 Tax=Anisakis simplex TaxID=6269 RepID=A0A0M3JKX1_ANISI|nr:unnamed protein product [Anisakis simplex]
MVLSTAVEWQGVTRYRILPATNSIETESPLYVEFEVTTKIMQDGASVRNLSDMRYGPSMVEIRLSAKTTRPLLVSNDTAEYFAFLQN